MQETVDTESDNIAGMTAKIVSAYVARNHVTAINIPELILNVHSALGRITQGPIVTAPAGEVEKPTPAQVRKSITPDALISFIDGKPYKTLKRHLSTHGLDPYSYRQRYGLPNDYPMVAANYAQARSDLAKAIGLGRPGGRAP